MERSLTVRATGWKAVIADDLTGAMDTGVQALYQGTRVTVCLADRIRASSGGSELVMLDTESRNVRPDEARAKVLDTLQELLVCGYCLVYKKIDSTLRGNIGSELDAVLLAHSGNAVLVAPALPWNGRTTLGGCHYVNGVRLADTELAKDPFSPVRHSYISDIISTHCARPVGNLTASVVDQGPQFVARHIEDLIHRGKLIIVGDAATEEHLSTLATAASLVPGVIPCGSAGLFRYVNVTHAGAAVDRASTAEPGRQSCGAERSPQDSPVLVVAGSPSTMSRAQVLHAMESRPRTIRLCLNEQSLFESQSSRAQEVSRVREETREALARGYDVILDGTSLLKQELLQKYSSSHEELRRRSDGILAALAEISKPFGSMLSGLVLLGGDTALSVCSALGAGGIEILGEAERYIPYGRLVGGSGHGTVVVTKAGGFGTPESLSHLIDFAKTQQAKR